MKKLTQENAAQHIGMTITSSRPLFRYYPLRVFRGHDGCYVADRAHVAYLIPSEKERGIPYDSESPTDRGEIVMNEWYMRAKKKLETEWKTGQYSRYAAAMKDAVLEALDAFCRQDGEFAQAVVQGGTFEDCMKAVARNCGNAISDLEAFRRAVQFYFPGADVQFQMSVNLCASVENEEPVPQMPVPKAGRKIISLADFL